jgi:hypothetical protein
MASLSSWRRRLLLTLLRQLHICCRYNEHVQRNTAKVQYDDRKIRRSLKRIFAGICPLHITLMTLVYFRWRVVWDSEGSDRLLHIWINNGNAIHWLPWGNGTFWAAQLIECLLYYCFSSYYTNDYQKSLLQRTAFRVDVYDKFGVMLRWDFFIELLRKKYNCLVLIFYCRIWFDASAPNSLAKLPTDPYFFPNLISFVDKWI